MFGALFIFTDWKVFPEVSVEVRVEFQGLDPVVGVGFEFCSHCLINRT